MFQIEVVRGVIGQKVCLYLGAVAGYHPFIAKKSVVDDFSART